MAKTFFGPSNVSNFSAPTSNSPFANLYKVSGKTPAPAPKPAAPPKTLGGRPLGFASPRQADMRVDRNNAAKNAAQNQEQSASSLLESIMAQLGSLGGGGGGGVSRAQIDAFQTRGAEDRARLEAMYKSYGDMIGARRGDIEGNYNTGTQNLTNAYNQAASATTANYDAARQAQTRQLQQLGLTEMAPPTNTEAQLQAAQQTEALRQAAIAEQEANRQAAVNQNISLQNAASREGTQQLQSFDQRLADMVSQMSMGGGGGGGGGGGAGASDIIRAYLGAAELDMDNQKAARDYALELAKFQRGGRQTDYGQVVKNLEAAGFTRQEAIQLAKSG
jgi:hypothetical protein